MHVIQHKILNLAHEKDLSPYTLRQIGELVGEPHPQKISHHLTQLYRKNLLRRDKQSGKIEVVKLGMVQTAGILSIPIVGSANCGSATIFADQNIEGFLKISERLVSNRRGLFVIKAIGNSMNRANIGGKNIEEGDYVIINSEAGAPKDGDYVLSIIDDVGNIKKYKADRKNNQIVLLSESTQDYPPIFIHPDDKFIINGRVDQVIKNFK
ncbi:hypothetical protein KKB41_01840 [Patescibacteria group bacterium]|nr:hypothetical protein [Patescibacteria group bacterium]